MLTRCVFNIVVCLISTGEPVPSGDAEAVQPRAAHPEMDELAGAAGRRHGAPGHAADDTHRDHAPRQGALGRGQRRVQAREVQRRRRQEPQRAARLLHGPEGVHRAELRDGGGESHGRRHPAAVPADAVAGVRPRADRRDHAAAQVRPPNDRQQYRVESNDDV
jgi:hypothetical protein